MIQHKKEDAKQEISKREIISIHTVRDKNNPTVYLKKKKNTVRMYLMKEPRITGTQTRRPTGKIPINCSLRFKM